MSAVRRLFALGAALGLLAWAPPAPAAINALDAVPAATLLLPYFEVDLSGARIPGAITVMHVGNVSASPVLAHLTLWTDLGVPTRAVDIYVGGHDVVEIDLRLLLLGIVPQRATNPWTGNVGSLSSGPTGFSGCPASWPEGGRLSAAEVAGLQSAHTGAASSLFGGSCAGAAHGDGLARGYVTVDVVGRCSSSTTFPGSPGYFATGGTGIATNQNVLFGEYTIISRSDNSDVSDSLVHVEASPALSSGYTFYGRLLGGTAADNREALYTQWMTRYLLGGAFDRGTRVVVWRDHAARAPFACGTPPDGITQVLVSPFDEEENVASLAATPLFPLATQAADLADAARFPIPFDFGFLFLDLNLAAPAAPFGTLNQAFVATQFRAQGRFATLFGGFPMRHVSAPFQVHYDFPTSQCADGIDNDGDGLIDFPNDPGCAAPDSPVENPQCNDGIDNDGDGLVDFPADPGCKSASDLQEWKPQCNDGVDNDGDGLVDFPADPGCTSVYDSSEAPNPVCSDGIDNDGDGLVDFPNDPGCASARGGTESPQCNDGADNDGDGLIDMADNGCSSPSDPTELIPQCNDGMDNDGDGRVDYPADGGCTNANDDSESPDPECSDGIDNDGNGLTDFPNDTGCGDRGLLDPKEAPDCSDGIDNDMDGVVDFPADPGCASATDQNEKTGTTTRQCSDGIDNDGDGLVDFPNDPGCISRYDDNEFN